MRQDPWLAGCVPKYNREQAPTEDTPANREHAQFIEGRAPNCPEYPILWRQDANGAWVNSQVCTSGEDEDEVGSAESSKEEEEKH